MLQLRYVTGYYLVRTFVRTVTACSMREFLVQLFIFFLFYIEHAKNVHYTDMPRPVIEEDIVKAIKFKLNNEEQARKKEHDKTVTKA